MNEKKMMQGYVSFQFFVFFFPGKQSGRMYMITIPISPLLEDSVKLGVPSVHVGVLPSHEAGGVQVIVFLCPADR